ncbi:MAG TPA: hypothetical protein ENN88_04315 [Candidatus Coatesbacteria bacterium]|nr:hypothetical protein [Candidatus Coatesbacteria bacterium]
MWRRIMPAIIFPAVLCAALVPGADGSPPEEALTRFLQALREGDLDAALELYDAEPFEGTGLGGLVEENLESLVAFIEETTELERARLSFGTPRVEPPAPEAEAAYVELGLPEASGWPHLVVELSRAYGREGATAVVERVYVMVPAADGWRVGFWFDSYRDLGD